MFSVCGATIQTSRCSAAAAAAAANAAANAGYAAANAAANAKIDLISLAHKAMEIKYGS